MYNQTVQITKFVFVSTEIGCLCLINFLNHAQTDLVEQIEPEKNGKHNLTKHFWGVLLCLNILYILRN